jgi:hypothetical protein
MKDQFKSLTGQALIQALNDNADEVIEKSYQLDLDQEDRDEITETLVNSIQRVQVLEEELKQINKEKKAVISEERLNVSENARTLRQGYTTKTGPVYVMRDQVAGIAYEYDADGVCVLERKLKPKERQLTTIRQMTAKQ